MTRKPQLQDDLKTLRESGHKAIAAQYRKMELTFRVIRTLANAGPHALTPEFVLEMCRKALRRFE